MMIRIAQIVTIVMALTLCNVTHGADKPNVKVKARIVETSYVAQFSGAARPGSPETSDRSSLDWLEKNIAAYIASRLGREFKFLNFSPAGSEVLSDNQYVLTVKLDRAAPATEAVGFHIGLDGPDTVSESEYLQFRNDQAAGEALGDKDAFFTEIELKLNQSSFLGIGAKLLKFVALSAEKATLIKGPILGWTMPYTRSQLCIDKGSKISVVNGIPMPPFGNVERIYTATALALSNPGESRIAQLNKPLITEADGNQMHLDDLLAAEPGDIVIEKIYVIVYRPIDQQSDCDPVIAPADIDFRGGS